MWQQENYLKVMIIDESKAHAFISSLFMFIQNFHPMQEYMWIVVARIVVTLTVKS